MVTATDAGGVITSLVTGRSVASIRWTSEVSVDGASFSPDSAYIATVGGRAAVWNARDGTRSFGLGDDVGAASYSRDGRFIASGTTYGDVEVRDSASGARIGGADVHRDEVRLLRFNDVGDHLVSASGDSTMRLWHLTPTDLRPDPRQLGGTSGGMNDATFLPHGALLTAGDDRTVRLWDVSTGDSLTILRLPRPPTLARVTPDAKSIVTLDFAPANPTVVRIYSCDVCRDREALLRLARTRATRTLTREERRTFLHQD